MHDRDATTRHFVQPGYTVTNIDRTPDGGYTSVTLEPGDEFVIDLHDPDDVADMVSEGFLGPRRPCH